MSVERHTSMLVSEIVIDGLSVHDYDSFVREYLVWQIQGDEGDALTELILE